MLPSVRKTKMSKFISKIFQFGVTRVRQSVVHSGPSGLTINVMNVSNLAKHGMDRTFSTVCREVSCCHVQTKSQLFNHKLCKDRATVSNTHSFYTCSVLHKEANGSNLNLTTENLIEAWFNEVNTFGTVRVRNIPFDVHIQPLNPMDYPDLNKSIVKVYYNATGSHDISKTLAGHKLSELGKLCNMEVCVEGEMVDVSCDVPHGVQLPVVCVITVPLKFDVDIKVSEKGSVVINGLECDSVNVHVGLGDCHLVNLRTGSVKVKCEEGNITCSNRLLGSIHLHCAKYGSIKGDRLQGTSVDCLTESGDINIKTVYANKSSCLSQSGSLHIRDCHGDMTARTDSGNLNIDSLDGKLSAEVGSGSADVYITRQEDVHIQSQQGDVTLRFSEDGSCSLDLDTPVIEHDESLSVDLNEQGKGFLKSETEHIVRASAPQGRISLKKQDWLSAIKLQFGDNTS